MVIEIRMERNLNELFTVYIEECEQVRRLSRQTVAGYKAVFRHFRNTMPEVTTPQTLSVERMVEFFIRIQKRTRIVGRNTEKVGVMISTVRTYSRKLSAFIEWLVLRGYLEENPVKKTKLPREEETKSPALRKNEIEKILAAISLHSLNTLILRRDIAMISTLLFCGVRLGEFVALQVRDIDLVKKEMIVRGETSKSRKTRVIPLHLLLVHQLREYLAERNKEEYRTESLFVSNNKDSGLTKEGIKHWTQKLAEYSGVKFHLHQFRHAFAVNLANAGVPHLKIQKLMGHADFKMTQNYLRSFTAENMGDDINKLSLENLM